MKLKDIFIYSLIFIVAIVIIILTIRNDSIEKSLEINEYKECIANLETDNKQLSNEKINLKMDMDKLMVNNLELQLQKQNLELNILETQLEQPLRKINVEVTAYCACSKCCGKNADGITASGTIATEGITCAVDPLIIPIGTKIWIPEYNMSLIAEDTGNLIEGYMIDIYFESHEEAEKFGRQLLEIYILNESR